jgi:hypothetical protein
MEQSPNSLDKIIAAQAIRKAERHLAKADPVMKRLIARHGHCPIAEREFEPFHPKKISWRSINLELAERETRGLWV